MMTPLALPTAAAADALLPRILNLTPFDPDISICVTGGLNRPAFAKTAGIAALFEHAQGLARELQIELGDVASGGGSDGNFTAPFVPTLDGLGVDGDGAHTAHEQLYVSSIAPRSRLLYRLFETLR